MGNNKLRSLYRQCDLNILSPPSSLVVVGALHVVGPTLCQLSLGLVWSDWWRERGCTILVDSSATTLSINIYSSPQACKTWFYAMNAIMEGFKLLNYAF